jgi:hypothetical protein
MKGKGEADISGTVFEARNLSNGLKQERTAMLSEIQILRAIYFLKDEG